MISFIVESHILHLLLIRIFLFVLLILIPIKTYLLIKLQKKIDTIILSLIQKNCLIRHCINCGHLGFFRHGIQSTVTTVSRFEAREFSHPYWNISKSLLFPETPWTTILNYLPIRLKIPSLTSSSKSPTFDFITILTRILLHLPMRLHCVWGGIPRLRIRKRRVYDDSSISLLK